MKDKNKLINLKKLYRNNFACYLLCAVCLICFTALTVKAYLNDKCWYYYFALDLISLICAIHVAYLNYNRAVYKDHDSLAGNASYIIKNAVMLSMQKKLPLYAGVFINVVDFRYINQRYSIDNGDKVIRLIIQHIDAWVNEYGGFSSRIGGDNYFVMIQKVYLEEFLEYLQRVYIPIENEGESFNIHIKFRAGINEVYNNSEYRSIIFYSSIALGAARETGKDFVRFEPYMLERFVKSKKLIADSKKALRSNEFIPFYQPKVNAQTGQLCGAEALVRWKQGDTMVSPGDFVPALEKCGIITDVDFRIFECVCNDLKNWIAAGFTPVKISSNFSKLHLKNPDFVSKIIEIKNRYGIDGKYLEIELTESAGISDFNIIKKCIVELNSAGIGISIDDFGTGYSSLSMLQTIHADTVKMDKSFLDNSFNVENNQFIIDVINIVRHQSGKVLFEGVETKEQYEFLKNSGCDIIQGFFFDKPLPRSEFEGRLKTPQYIR